MVRRLRLNESDLKSTRVSKRIKQVSSLISHRQRYKWLLESVRSAITLKPFDVGVQNVRKANKSTQTTQSKSIKLKPSWIVQVDPNGVEHYINVVDGASTYDASKARVYNEAVRPLNALFATNKTSLTNLDQLRQMNRDNHQIDKRIEAYDKYYSDCHLWPKQLNHTITLEKIHKQDLRDLTLIGQVDSKFIATFRIDHVYEGFKTYSIILFDQHAVHERITLEQLLKRNVDERGRIHSVDLDKPIEMETSSGLIERESYLLSFKQRLNKIGFDFETVLRDQGAVLQVTKIPGILFKRLDTDSFKNFLLNLFTTELKNLGLHGADHISKPGSELGTAYIPPELIDIFNMDACRSSIKFGDRLDRVSCSWLVKELPSCKLPFQCAHGRPTMAPLLRIFNQIDKRPPICFKKLLKL